VTAAPVELPLRAVTRACTPPDDLFDALGPGGAAWWHEGCGFVTAGVAARVAPNMARTWLAAIDHDDDVDRAGTGPIAVGALPFDPDGASTLVVPRQVVGRDAEGRGWITRIGDPVRPLARRERAPSAIAVLPRTTRAEWDAAVDAALAAIAGGELEKVVLARRVDLDADRPFEPAAVLRRLCEQQPGCFVYAGDGMVGASPELLVRRRGEAVESQPMAGTSTLTDQAAIARLRASVKDAREHRLVVDAIVEALQPLCVRIEPAPEPSVARFADVAHLTTSVRGLLRAPAPDAVELARRLHPTPAVGGTPRGPALETIARLEDFPRDRYAGPVGWVDARGDGEWALALRGAAIDGTRATLHAGAGIVAGSVPADEWCETEAKLEPMIRALVGAAALTT
jgi:menaquinone-specific isochorismate synthase